MSLAMQRPSSFISTNYNNSSFAQTEKFAFSNVFIHDISWKLENLPLHLKKHFHLHQHKLIQFNELFYVYKLYFDGELIADMFCKKEQLFDVSNEDALLWEKQVEEWLRKTRHKYMLKKWAY